MNTHGKRLTCYINQHFLAGFPSETGLFLWCLTTFALADPTFRAKISNSNFEYIFSIHLHKNYKAYLKYIYMELVLFEFINFKRHFFILCLQIKDNILFETYLEIFRNF